ncbi:lysoplasmalogenase [Streptomyces sp. AV19]|uniref:lysoplasmalogenase n=1 Tax=Streptomyces sp. AV19 TaxID=2793068 RepID=UPI001F388879|nr:lysoplasmalogenase [Streptomyces sp. AV19]MDG4532505.1 lysoplasmalogenase [Streptomyces sp. AV19]
MLTGATPVARATKPVLMPLLAEYVLVRGGPPLLAVALLLGCAGDVLLQAGGETAFLLGMGAFAAGHLCYLGLFARYGGASADRPDRPGAAGTPGRWRLPGVPDAAGPAGKPHLRPALGYAAAWAATTALLWPGLPGRLRPPVALYGLLLTATAYGALRTGRRGAAGGALFLLSDTLIASGLAKWPQAPAPQFWIMLTYLGAQALLADAVVRAAAETEGAGRRPGPLRRWAGRQPRAAARASTMP